MSPVGSVNVKVCDVIVRTRVASTCVSLCSSSTASGPWLHYCKQCVMRHFQAWGYAPAWNTASRQGNWGVQVDKETGGNSTALSTSTGYLNMATTAYTTILRNLEAAFATTHAHLFAML